jgi:hypothetical protein
MRRFAFAAAAMLLALAPVLALDGEPGMHDPSTVIEAGGKFYVSLCGSSPLSTAPSPGKCLIVCATDSGPRVVPWKPALTLRCLTVGLTACGAANRQATMTAAAKDTDTTELLLDIDLIPTT